jgi:hypothetical protein
MRLNTEFLCVITTATQDNLSVSDNEFNVSAINVAHILGTLFIYSACLFEKRVLDVGWSSENTVQRQFNVWHS